MQIRAAAPRLQAAKPAPKPQMADRSFGSEIVYHGVSATANVGQLVPLPAAIAGALKIIPAGLMGYANLGLGLFNGVRDLMGLRKENNLKKGDDCTRLAGDAAVMAGGAAIAFGAALAPVLVPVGFGLAAAGALVRMVGVWNDDTRI